MKSKSDKTHVVPIMDCPSCGEKNIPLSTIGPLCKEGKPDIYISFCPKCDAVPEDESCIKGYVSIEELEQMGWKRE